MDKSDCTFLPFPTPVAFRIQEHFGDDDWGKRKVAGPTAPEASCFPVLRLAPTLTRAVSPPRSGLVLPAVALRFPLQATPPCPWPEVEESRALADRQLNVLCVWGGEEQARIMGTLCAQ